MGHCRGEPASEGYFREYNPAVSVRLGQTSDRRHSYLRMDRMHHSILQEPDTLAFLETEASTRRLVLRFFEYLETQCGLYPDAYAVVHCLEEGLVRVWRERKSHLGDTNHPIRKFLELVLNLCRCYDDQSGQRAEALLTSTRQIIVNAVEQNVESEAVYYRATQHLARLLGQHNTKSKVFEKRVIETENGRLQINEAHSIVRNTILKEISGKSLPSVFFRFLHEIWEKYLYVTYLREGTNSHAWRQSVVDTSTMAWCLATDDRSALFTAQQQVFDTLHRVTAAIDTIHINDHRELATSFFDLFQSSYVAKILGTESSVHDHFSIPLGPEDQGTAPETDDRQETVIPAIIALKTGGWYLHTINGLNVRHKLVENNIKQARLLFCNLSGIRSLRLSFQDAEKLLDSAALRQIDTSPVYDKALGHALDGIIQPTRERAGMRELRFAHDDLQTQIDKDIGAIQPGVTTGEALESDEDSDVEVQLRKTNGSENQSRDGIPLAETTCESMAVKSWRTKKISDALLEVNKIRTGGWAYFLTGENEPTVCRLGLKNPESGELLFVDCNGKKRGEFTPAELAQRIAHGNAAILDFGLTGDD